MSKSAFWGTPVRVAGHAVEYLACYGLLGSTSWPAPVEDLSHIQVGVQGNPGSRPWMWPVGKCSRATGSAESGVLEKPQFARFNAPCFRYIPAFWATPVSWNINISSDKRPCLL